MTSVQSAGIALASHAARLEHFNIGNDRMPKEVYHAYGYVKKAAAVVNTEAGRLPAWKGQLIQRVSDEVISGALDADFPLYVWQTGSGTQSNMNVNEVISNRCIQLTGGTLGSQQPVHPNDHVNMGQSSNDTFPTRCHRAKDATERTIRHAPPPGCDRREVQEVADVVKIGRTHLEDATPLTVGQEWSGYAGALDDAIAEVEHTTRGLLKLAMGGTAVGTGLNAPAGSGSSPRPASPDDGDGVRDCGQQVHRAGHAGPDDARPRRPQGRGADVLQDR